jgi:hypothetical protein
MENAQETIEQYWAAKVWLVHSVPEIARLAQGWYEPDSDEWRHWEKVLRLSELLVNTVDEARRLKVEPHSRHELYVKAREYIVTITQLFHATCVPGDDHLLSN